MWLRSTLRWLLQRAASAIAARCARWATADGEAEGQAAAYRQAVCTGAHCTIGPKSRKGGKRAMALPEAEAVQREDYPHTMNLSR